MPSIRLATFNVENLFIQPSRERPSRASDRRFGSFVFEDDGEAMATRRMVEAALSDDERQLTAQAILDCEADFVAVQEVENEAALRLFRDEYLHAALRRRVAAELKAAQPDILTRSLGVSDKPKEQDEWRRDELEKVRIAAEARHCFGYLRVVEGNDGRGIDVGFLSRLPVASVISHAHLTFAEVPGSWNSRVERALDSEWNDRGRARGLPRPSVQDRIFRRDCLEVRLDVGGQPFTVFNCHFKANPPSRNATFPLRQAEARALRHLIERRFGGPEASAAANWAICGDLNDYLVVDGDPRMPDLMSGEWQESALTELLVGPSPLGVDVSDWIADPTDRWTSWFPRDDVYSQLDHIIVSPRLAELNQGAKVDIIRAGQPLRVERYTGPRYPRIGIDRPKASDHCPMAVTLKLA